MFMTPDEVVWFANHKYGECAYLIEYGNEMMILTTKSKWRILLNDLHRFGHYTLFHLNHATDRVHYHKQCESRDLDYLVYYAIRHDLDLPCDMREFERLWEMYCRGRELEESVAIFEFLSEGD